MTSFAGLGGYPDIVAQYLNNPRAFMPQYWTELGFFSREIRRFRYNSHLGSGTSGEAFIFDEINRDGAELRQVVVKIPLEEGLDKGVTNEAIWLNILRNARHIVDMIDIDQRGLSRPILVTEYLKNGTLNTLRTRTVWTGTRIPNRILWRIFLCLTKAVVGMAYSTPFSRDFQAEEIPPRDVLPRTLVHDDLHDGNILIGDIYSNEDEHAECPIVKLIDFGEAHRADPSEGDNLDNRTLGDYIGICHNLLDVGFIMEMLATGDEWDRGDDLILVPGKPLPIRTIATQSLMMQPMDPDLKFLIAWCLAANPNELPSLDVVLAACQTAVRDRTAAFYTQRVPYIAANETGPVVQDFLQQMIFDPAMDDDEVDVL